MRINLDGSQMEVLVTNPRHNPDAPPKSGMGPIAIDLVHKALYWGGARSVGGFASAQIYRMNLPPVLKPTTMPSPPLITGISPLEQHAGGEVTLTGENLRLATAVSFIDDSDGKHLAARFHPGNNGEAERYGAKDGESIAAAQRLSSRRQAV